MIPHYVNICVEVEHNETSFDYQSLMYTINKDNPPIMIMGVKVPSTI
jgi:hypothetical protein